MNTTRIELINNLLIKTITFRDGSTSIQYITPKAAKHNLDNNLNNSVVEFTPFIENIDHIINLQNLENTNKVKKK